MKMNLKKPSTVEEYQLVTRYENLRQKLLEPRFEDRMEKPLAFWALASDRRLPLAFLGLSLRELLAMEFPELLATPGIGQKKLASLLTLLDRATKDLPPGAAPPADAAQENVAPLAHSGGAFEAENVSEALWVQWREAVEQHKLGYVKLGRLAPTLQALPTVIWNKPLADYTDLTLAEIRQLKTHGEKRVRVVLEIFALVHQSLIGLDAADGAAVHEYLNVRLEPKFIQPLEQWIMRALAADAPPSLDELRDSLARPLLDQTRLDLGDTVAELADGRLGVDRPPQSVRGQAEARNVTRARVYQLLDDCAKAMHVRWPEGEWLFAALEQKLCGGRPDAEMLRLFRATRDLFFPRAVETPQLATPAGAVAAPTLTA
jgi:hypothetical protein